MRMHRRHLPMLERLDERIVPSGVGMAPIHHAALAEHPAIHANAHAAVQPKAIHHAKAFHHAKAVHHARVHHFPQITPVVSTLPAVAVPTAGTTVVAVSTAGTTAASSATVVAAPETQAQMSADATSAPVTSAPATAVGSFSPVTTAPAVTPQPTTTTDPGDIENGPLAKAGQDLIKIYEEFEQQGGDATFTSSEAKVVKIVGTSVGVDVHSAGGNFGNLVSAMTALGMQVQAQDASHGIIEGLLPIGQLVAAAQNSQTLSLSPIYIPVHF